MNWTQPWGYEIPQLYDSSVWDWFLTSVKTSIRSISDNAFIVLGIATAFCLISALVSHFSHMSVINEGVKKRSLSREIFSADVSRNLDHIVNHKVKEMEVNFLARNRYHQKNFKLEVQDRVNSMEVSMTAQNQFKNSEFYKKNAENYYKTRKGR